jgi:hypothetical protein
MWVYWIIFFLIVTLGAFYKFKLSKKNIWLFLFLWFVLFFIAAFRDEGVDNDYLNYLTAIKGDGAFNEPSFLLISYICYDLLGSTKLVFITYSFLSVSLLFYGLKKLSIYFFLSLAIYYSTSYVIHDLNAIRAGVGVGFILLAFDSWVKEDAKKTFIFIFLATFFHISFLMFFLFYFLLKNNNKFLTVFILLVPLAYLSYFLRIDALSLLLMVPISQVKTLALAYSEWNKEIVSSVNVFSVLILIKLMLFWTLIIFKKQLSLKLNGFYLYFKMYSLGLFLLIFLAELPGAAYRVSDLLWISECLLLPTLVILINPRWVITTLIILLCLIMVWLNYVQSDFVRPYHFNFEL